MSKVVIIIEGDYTPEEMQGAVELLRNAGYHNIVFVPDGAPITDPDLLIGSPEV